MAYSKPFTYNKNSELNQGSFGSICEGRLTSTGEPIAVKVASPLSAHINRAEYEILKSVQGHRNIVKVYDIIDEDNELAFAIEKAEFSLHEMLQKPRYVNGIPPNALRDLLNDVANAFKFLRVKNVAHRDFKPGNILIFPKTTSKSRSEFCFKLCDFGGAKVVNADQELNTLVGSPAFLCPEMAIHLAENQGRSEQWKLEEPYTAMQVDMWCIGVTLYQASTGKHAFPLKIQEAGILHKQRPPGAIAGMLVNDANQKSKRYKCRYTNQISNPSYPQWLIACVSQVISNLLDTRSYDVFISSAEEIFNMPTRNVILLDSIRVIEHADLAETKNFRSCDISLNRLLNLSDSKEYQWIGGDSIYTSWSSQEVSFAELPSDSCILWATGSQSVTVEKKKWQSEFDEKYDYADPESEYYRRKRYFNFGFNALDDSDHIIKMWKLIIVIIKKQIHNLCGACKSIKEWTEFGQVFSAYASSFGKSLWLCGENQGLQSAENADGAGKEFTIGIDRIANILAQLSFLDTVVSKLSIEEYPVLQATEDLENLSRRSDAVTKFNQGFGRDDENWMHTLCSKCATRRSLVADQIKQQYENSEGILYVISNLIGCAVEVKRISEDIKHSIALLEASFAGSQRMVNSSLAEKDISSRTMSRNMGVINHSEKIQNNAKEIHILTKKLNERMIHLTDSLLTREREGRSGEIPKKCDELQHI